MEQKGSWFLIFSILIAMMGLAYQQNLTGEIEEAELLSANEPPVATLRAEPRVPPLNQPALSEPVVAPTQNATSPVTASTPDSQPASVEVKATQVEELSAQLEQLQDRAQELTANLENSEQVQSLAEDRQVLSFSLQSLSQQEEEILRRTQDALNNQSHVYQATYQQLERDIQEQQALLNQTQNDLTAWDSPFVSDRSLQEDNLITLNDLRLQQQETLESLRQQRLNLANQILTGQQLIQQQREVALNQVQEVRWNLQNQSSSLAAELRAQQTMQLQSQTELKNIQEQIRRTQQALQTQQQELQRLEISTQ